MSFVIFKSGKNIQNTHSLPNPAFFNNSNTNEDIATKFEQEYVRCVRNAQDVPFATEPGIFFNNSNTNKDITTKQKHITVTFLFISHTTNVLLSKFRCNILFCVRIIKEMPGSVASGTPCISLFGTGFNRSEYDGRYPKD
jgi:hypothetical protein